jgi:hypothetical protein
MIRRVVERYPWEYLQQGNDMTTNAVSAWQARFRKAAEADQMNLLREHLRKLELPDDPELLLKGTLMMVPVSLVYHTMDGNDIETFFDMQTYDPARAKDACYAITFDLFGIVYARVLSDESLRGCDLADMHGAAWLELQMCGYHGFYISRVDGEELSAEEVAVLEELVRDDLYFDFTEDELAVWFDDSRSPDYLYVDVREIDDQLDD